MFPLRTPHRVTFCSAGAESRQPNPRRLPLSHRIAGDASVHVKCSAVQRGTGIAIALPTDAHTHKPRGGSRTRRMPADGVEADPHQGKRSYRMATIFEPL